MAEIALRRVTDEHAAGPCEDLFREYIDWVSDQLLAHHGVPLDAHRTETVHAEFRAEWPKLLGAAGRIYLASVDGAPAAVGVLKPVSTEVGELKRMFVRPAHRGLGLGRLLASRLVDDSRALGHRWLRLESFDFMTSAHALYRSLGFRDSGPFDGSEAARHGVATFETFMVLDLTHRPG
jgi:GNAT superfamily N-acetyltransferase